MSVIERASPVPYYEQLYDLLLSQIRSGAIERGTRLPGESELHRDLNLSRATVRQALELLEAHGWATKVPRRGFFAASPQPEEGWRIDSEQGFLDSEIAHGNADVTTDVLSAAEGRLPDHAAEALGVDEGAGGFVLERLRSLDGNLVLYSTNFTPATVSPVVAEAVDVLEGRSSLTQALREGGYVPAGARRVLHARAAPRHIARHLQVPDGSALLRVRCTTWDRSNRPYDYYETWLRTDRVPLELNFSSTTA